MKYSLLMLGTVQFGMNYGVANTHGKPSYETVKNILKEAFDGGVNALDTAPEYGDSEEVIGKALKELGLLNKFNTVTKIPAIPKDCDPEKFIENSLKKSLKRLQQEDHHQIILWSVREGHLLQEAVDYCAKRGLEFYAVNTNYPEETPEERPNRKVTAYLF